MIGANCWRQWRQMIGVNCRRMAPMASNDWRQWSVLPIGANELSRGISNSITVFIIIDPNDWRHPLGFGANYMMLLVPITIKNGDPRWQFFGANHLTILAPNRLTPIIDANYDQKWKMAIHGDNLLAPTKLLNKMIGANTMQMAPTIGSNERSLTVFF